MTLIICTKGKDKIMEFVNFCDNLYSSIDKKILRKLDRGYSRAKPFHNFIAYCFDNSYIRIYYDKHNELLEITITVENYGPNERTFYLHFKEEEINDKTVQLFTALISILSFVEACPEYYKENSAFLEEIAYYDNLHKKCRIPLSYKKYEEYLKLYYGAFLQVMCFEMEFAKNNMDLWIDFFNSEYYKVFEIISENSLSFEKYCEIINNSSFPKTLKNKLIHSKSIKQYWWLL